MTPTVLSPPKRVLVSGSSGTIGSALVADLSRRGAVIARLIRSDPSGPDDIPWRPLEGWVDQDRLGAFAPDAVVHLAGESVFGWFSDARKRRIRDSRELGTRTIVRALCQLPRPPAVLASASAVGVYGDRGDAELDEAAGPGSGFLADVCRAWETEALRATAAGIRTVTMRIGVVLSPTGGALQTMRPAYVACLGGPIAGGKAWVPWISLDDSVAAIVHLLHANSVHGPVNVVSPSPVQQGELARSLGSHLRRPAIVPVPGWLLSATLGELAHETVLKSIRALPRVLLESGFEFKHPTLDAALTAALQRGRRALALDVPGVVS